MGANLARNAARRGVTVAVYNRTTEKTDAFLHQFGSEGEFIACNTLQELLQALSAPRSIILMVKAGEAVDDLIRELLPQLSPGDTLIDAGNSLYSDTDRREAECAKHQVHFVGMGVSGGEEGALNGPSMMPAGPKEAVEALLPVLTKMAADDGAGGTCVANIGPGGSGHFVKMVHNGIEYAVMQVLAECYHLWKVVGGLTHAQMAEEVALWNADSSLRSFLLEITEKIFRTKDPETGKDALDVILDASGQKGTGRWTVQAAQTLGVAVPMITAAVDARILSSAKHFRVKRSTEAPEALLEAHVNKEELLSMVRGAYLLSMMSAYSEGFLLLSVASRELHYNLSIPEIARIWRGGCIIRSGMLPLFQKMFAGEQEALLHLRGLFAGEAQLLLRQTVQLGAARGIPLPAITAALHSYDAYRSAWLPQNLTNAQRDFFGAHGFERTDSQGSHHLAWNA